MVHQISGLTIIDDFTDYNLRLSPFHMLALFSGLQKLFSNIATIMCKPLDISFVVKRAILSLAKKFLCRFTVLQGFWNKSCTRYQQLHTVQALEVTQVVFLNH